MKIKIRYTLIIISALIISVLAQNTTISGMEIDQPPSFQPIHPPPPPPPPSPPPPSPPQHPSPGFEAPITIIAIALVILTAIKRKKT